jgi:hypothetical protein
MGDSSMTSAAVARVSAVLSLGIVAHALGFVAVGVLTHGFRGTFLDVPVFDLGVLEEPVRTVREFGAAQLVVALPVVGYFRLLSRALRRRERVCARTMFEVDSVGGKQTPFAEDWDRRSELDVLLSIVALVPILGVPAILALGVRILGALELHERHEEAVLGSLAGGRTS